MIIPITVVVMNGKVGSEDMPTSSKVKAGADKEVVGFPSPCVLESWSSLIPYIHIKTNTHISSIFITMIYGNLWALSLGPKYCEWLCRSLGRSGGVVPFIFIVNTLAIACTLSFILGISGTPASSYSLWVMQGNGRLVNSLNVLSWISCWRIAAKSIQY